MLTTRCPSCGTTFRVRPEQLTARNGRVRCGKCHTAFSALSSLEEMAEDSVAVAGGATPRDEASPAIAAALATRAPTVVEAAAEQAPAASPEAPTAPPRQEAPDASEHVVAEPITLASPQPVDLPFKPDFDLDFDEPVEPLAPAEWLSTSTNFDDELRARAEADMAPPPSTNRTQWDMPSLPAAEDLDLREPTFFAPHRAADEGDLPAEPIVVHGLEPGFDLDLDEHPADESPPPPHTDPEAEAIASPVAIEDSLDEPETPRREPGHPDFGDEPMPVAMTADGIGSLPEISVTPTPTAFLEDEITPLRVEPPRKRSVWWLIGCLLLLIVATLAGAYVFRTELARAYPPVRPTLEEACANFGCTVPFPTDAKLIVVEGTDLIPDPSSTGHYRLVVTLRNRADYPQRWPQLELTLTDRFDRALSRRVIAPAEWLPKEIAGERAFEARGEVTSNVPISTELPAAGYRVYAFYP
ncbi:MAG: DUF3426 domain-containing protein [Rhodocyclaceae bacterium]